MVEPKYTEWTCYFTEYQVNANNGKGKAIHHTKTFITADLDHDIGLYIRLHTRWDNKIFMVYTGKIFVANYYEEERE